MKVKCVLGFRARCLFGRLARAMTKKCYVLGKVEYEHQNLISAKIFKLP